MMETLIKCLIGAFKCGKERVVQKEAAGEKTAHGGWKKKIGFSKETVIWEKEEE